MFSKGKKIEFFFLEYLKIETIVYICIRLEIVLSSLSDFNAGVVELVDTLDLGSSAARCEGSSPFARTKSLSEMRGFFISWRF